jgi:hypothetical protein
MKNKKKLFIGIVITIGTLAVIFCQKYSFCYPLLAKGVVPVYATASDAMTKRKGHLKMMELFPQQSVQVLRIMYTKDDYAIEIRLPDGRSGFVDGEDVSLLGEQKPFSFLPCSILLLRECP